MKKAVRKSKQRSLDFQRERQLEKELWTMKVIAYAQQEMLDAVAITLKRSFGFGEKRQKQFHDDFEEVYDWIRRIEREDTPDGEYSTEKQEEALRWAWGSLYQPRQVRYDVKVIDAFGGEHKL